MNKLIIAVLAVAGFLLAEFELKAQSEGKTDAKKEAQPVWESLFDGKTLSGWTPFDQAKWKVTPEGVLVGEGPMGHLFSPQII